MPELLMLEQPSRGRPAPEGFALWRLGFRPFYLMASIFAALSIALWALQYAGWLDAPYLHGPIWHAHEMVFGYTLAVVTGFLLTAVTNWTQRATPSGGWLGAMALLWIAGRVLVLTPFHAMAALVNVAFPLAVAVAIGIPLVHSRNRRNYFFIALMIMIGLAALAVHLEQLGMVDLPGWLGIRFALDIVLFIMTVMSGRVIPMFSNNGVPECGALRLPRLEQAVLGSTLALVLVDAVQLQGIALNVVLVVCACAHLARWMLWKPWNTTRVPLVWVLHAAYVWIPIHLMLRVLAQWNLVPDAIATHALTLGAIGGLTIGMMVRTARGHTGRGLKADRYEVACFSLIMLAAIVRVFGPLAMPGAYIATILVSALLWSVAFGLYAVRYWPILTRPRLDGRPG